MPRDKMLTNSAESPAPVNSGECQKKKHSLIKFCSPLSFNKYEPRGLAHQKRDLSCPRPERSRLPPHAFFISLRAQKLRASRFSSSCEKVGKKKRTLASNFSPFQAVALLSMLVHELREKSVHFRRIDIAVCQQAARGRMPHIPPGFCESRILFPRHSDVCRTQALPRRCKTRARPAESSYSSLLLTTLLPPSVSRLPEAECVEGALWGA